ncbi:hypothetical protein Val02_36450 [Virgisporangium aliadipatigenens]|uniref:SGNH domain-containing protein n=1 Tax=Virgisporangium aliadipatigenens TaxID=741659 RepID=A0A8J3YK14_9ACTN|nr:hypothetical protein Val02_36450 [Virgisporangium aliadipatigenens]
MVTYVKGSCPFAGETFPVPGPRAQPDCRRWSANVRAALLGDDRPDPVLTTSGRYPLAFGEPVPAPALFVDGLRPTWSELADAGLPVAVLVDTPVMATNVAECVTANRDRLTRCATPRARATNRAAAAAQLEAARGLNGVSLVDLTAAVCPADPCAPVIGGVLFYRDNNHLTGTYARSLAPRLSAALPQPPA